MELKEVSEALNSYIRPSSFPVAVRTVSSASEIPERAKMPKRDFRVTMTVCQGIAMARRYGSIMAMGEEDMICVWGALTLGFLPSKDKSLDGSFNVPVLGKNQDIRAKMGQYIPRFEHGKYTHFIAAPLHRADFEPQVIIVYGNPAQITRLIQAGIYVTGEPVVSSSMGQFACSQEITQTILSDECRFVMGSGDRIFASLQDHEMSFAMPIGKVESIIEGLEGSHRLGVRYPTRTFLTHQSQFPSGINDLMHYLREDE